MEKYYINQRRQRANQLMRELAADVVFSHKQFIQPLFVSQLISKKEIATSLSSVFIDTKDSVIQQIESDLNVGISKFLLFPIPSHKSTKNFDFSFSHKLIKRIKSKFGARIWLAVDVCLCAYTSHGHCGILNVAGDQILNNESVSELADYALGLAESGADCIAPSDMMDGRISSIRKKLNEHNLERITIMSYSSKFSSNLYGPFRDVCNSSPDQQILLRDRKSYQISFNNSKDAIASSLRDIQEGSDIVMVKPALPYLDIVSNLNSLVNVPIAVYQVSGEYQSIELLAKNNLLERNLGHLEMWTSMIRAGANIIISYAARNAKEWIEM